MGCRDHDHVQVFEISKDILYEPRSWRAKPGYITGMPCVCGSRPETASTVKHPPRRISLRGTLSLVGERTTGAPNALVGLDDGKRLPSKWAAS
jgi:hypothetical protein